MTNEEQILATLNKILDVQTEVLALQKQSIENQQKAITSAQASIAHQFSTGRLYRISLAILGCLLAFLLYKFYGPR